MTKETTKLKFQPKSERFFLEARENFNPTEWYIDWVAKNVKTFRPLKTIEGKRAYIGFEVSSQSITIGNLSTITHLLIMEKLGAKAIIFLAPLHTRLNQKPLVKLNLDFCKIFKNVEIIDQNDLLKDPSYLLKAFELSTILTVKKAFKAMSQINKKKFKEQIPENVKFSNCLYGILQVVDISHMSIDIAIGGLDQLKIHSLSNDFVDNTKDYLHYSILLDKRGKKISKSQNNSPDLSSEAKIEEFVKDIELEFLESIFNLFLGPVWYTRSFSFSISKIESLEDLKIVLKEYLKKVFI